MYVQPLNTDLWLCFLGFFGFTLLAIAILSKEVSSVGWGFLWLYGVIVDQIQDVPKRIQQSKTTRFLLIQVLPLWFLFAYVISNHYRAKLNVNSVFGNALVLK